MSAIQLGLYSINGNICAIEPDTAIMIAQTAERSGWESVWTAEHYLLPDPAIPSSPVPGHVPLLDPFVALANVASHTTTLKLGTGVTVVPLHEPVTLAKRVMSLDRVSKGRFLFGVGVGYLEPEFAAAGRSLVNRGARTDEYLDAMTAIWNETTPTYDGRFVQLSGLRSEPRPTHLPGPPLHVGGRGPAAFARAAQRGHGWYGYGLELTEVAEAITQLRAAESAGGRPESLPPLEFSVSLRHTVPVDRGTVDQLVEMGVTRLIVVPPRDALRTADALRAFVESTPEQLGVTQ